MNTFELNSNKSSTIWKNNRPLIFSSHSNKFDKFVSKHDGAAPIRSSDCGQKFFFFFQNRRVRYQAFPCSPHYPLSVHLVFCSLLNFHVTIRLLGQCLVRRLACTLSVAVHYCKYMFVSIHGDDKIIVMFKIYPQVAFCEHRWTGIILYFIEKFTAGRVNS